jgi:divalent metal cation (Fe/Co/Zn/Cd) transporter
MVTEPHETSRQLLLRRGQWLELTTLGWNVIGVAVLVFAAVKARSVALAGFGLDSVIEIGASIVVLWELADVAQDRRHRAMKMIGSAFIAQSLYLTVQSTAVLIIGFRPRHSSVSMVWTALTTLVMFVLAAGKAKTGAGLGNPVLKAEGRVTKIDGILAIAVLAGLAPNAFAD